VSFVAFIIRALVDVVFQEDAKNYRLFIPKRSNSDCKFTKKSHTAYHPNAIFILF